jgi:hypothetical protein
VGHPNSAKTRPFGAKDGGVPIDDPRTPGLVQPYLPKIGDFGRATVAKTALLYGICNHFAIRSRGRSRWAAAGAERFAPCQ